MNRQLWCIENKYCNRGEGCKITGEGFIVTSFGVVIKDENLAGGNTSITSEIDTNLFEK